MLINLFAAAGLVFAAWDISRVVRFESFGVNLATQLGGGIGMIYLVTVAIFAIPAIVSALTLGMSGLGTGLFGGILLLVSIVLLLFGERIPGGFLSGEFLYTGVPYLVPVAAFMLFAGIGAHFARRSGRRQVRRASGGGV
ncbi:hypothetical protein FM112_11650 [Gulosibacter sp. 10]|nr:hypothetical protein FM112_11650 [Gulosibacter sp. 10]